MTTFWMLHCMLWLRISTINIYIDRDAMQTHRSNRGYEYFSTLSLKWCHGSVAFFIFGAASQCLFHFRSKQKTSLSAPSEGSKKPLHPKRKLLACFLFYKLYIHVMTEANGYLYEPASLKQIFAVNYSKFCDKILTLLLKVQQT